MENFFLFNLNSDLVFYTLIYDVGGGGNSLVFPPPPLFICENNRNDIDSKLLITDYDSKSLYWGLVITKVRILIEMLYKD